MQILSAGVLCVLAFAARAQQAQPALADTRQDIPPGAVVAGQLNPVPNGIVVVQSTHVGRGGAPGGRGTAPAPSPGGAPTPLPTIPAGYVVVQSNYLDQVSATASAAINSAKSNEESLVGIMKVAGWIVAALVAVCGLFGYKAFSDIWKTQKEMTETLDSSKKRLKQIDSMKNEALPRIQAAIAEVQDMEAILVDLWFLRTVHQDVKQFLKEDKADAAAAAAADALPEGKRVFRHASEHHERQIKGEPMSPDEDSAVRQATTAVGERVLSYVAAVMGVLSMRAGVLDDAVDWARLSVQYNPRKLSDRQFNLACVLAQRYKKNEPFMKGSEAVSVQCMKDKAEALQILRDGISQKEISWREARDDDDFAPFVAEIDAMKPEV